MDDILKIIERMEAPLIFSSRDAFKNIHIVRDLEKFLLNLVDELKHHEIEKDKKDGISTKLEGAFSALEGIFTGFDLLDNDEKKKRIIKSLDFLKEIRILQSQRHVSDSPCEIIKKEEPGLRDMEIAFQKLSQPVQYLKGVGPRIGSLLDKKNLKTIDDMIYFLPRRYEDRRVIKKISTLELGRRETVIGKVFQAEIKRYTRRKYFEVIVADESGTLRAKWFKGNFAFFRQLFKQNEKIILTGEVKGILFDKEMIHPDFEILDNDRDELLHFKRIVPIYSETEGLNQKHLRRIMMNVVENYSQYVMSPIPEEICNRVKLIDIQNAIRNAHFPDLQSDMGSFNGMESEAHKRIVFDEFFFFEIGMALRKKGNLLERGTAFNITGNLLSQFYNILPFKMTEAQSRVIKEIHGDMRRPHPMNRLIQGDVGSGKTVVAMAAMITACDNGYQAALMAPTEILADQHYKNIKGWTERLGLKTIILTGTQRSYEKKQIYRDIARGEIQIIVGTHALIQEGVSFHKLGIAVIDEQHRFGVIQRAALRQKGESPDVLVMTATPIPRTLALTVYGDLDLSVVDQMPPGKKPVRTKVFYERDRDRVYEIIRNQVMKESQVFIVYPLVSESETLDLKDATRMAEYLQQNVFPEFNIGLIHGRLKSADKERIMADFIGKRIHILVCTTVIEVGIDIPEASLMVIEHAERFGLAQLHQLRGRVGRGDMPAYCILMADRRGSQMAARRLRIMEETNDGFRIAEEDLVLRGPGEFLGTRQSGLPDFRVANVMRHGRILSEARSEAFSVVEKDPRLEKPEHRMLREVLLKRWSGRLNLARTG